MVKLYLLIGPSGSGKSTKARKLASETNAVVCSADDYFYDLFGKYNFDANKLGFAHKMCYDKAKRNLEDGKSVIIDNTNLVAKDRKKYLDLALEFGAKADIVVIDTYWSTDVDALLVKNTKGTPRHVIERHVEQFQNFLANA